MKTSFPANYREAANQFVAAARHAGAAFDIPFTHPSATGPQGEALITHVARLGSDTSRRMMLVTSGVHGIEGYAGSAAQTNALLQGVFNHLADDMAVVLVHALNPYGFAHLRRSNEDGVDLNRNFVDWRHLPTEHEHTAWLTERMFVPQPRPDEVKAFIAEQGEAVYTKALTKGQYRFPLGLCYGGTRPSWSRHVWSVIRGRYADFADEIVHIDLHTGYGVTGGATILPADDITPEAAARAKAWWGEQVEYVAPGPGAALAHVSGPIEASLSGYKRRSSVVMPVTVESGTIPFPEVLDTLIKDHQRVAAGLPSTAESHAAIRRAYAPEDSDWQRNVTESFTDVLHRGVQGMKSERPFRGRSLPMP